MDYSTMPRECSREDAMQMFRDAIAALGKHTHCGDPPYLMSPELARRYHELLEEQKSAKE